MPHVLHVLKVGWPNHFREILRVNPATFDHIVDKIKDDPVFYNNSNNPQIPVEEQLAIRVHSTSSSMMGMQEAMQQWPDGQERGVDQQDCTQSG